MAQRDDNEFHKWAFTSRDPAKVTEALQYAQRHFHLISPAADCPGLPEGCEIATSFVLVDVERETYDARPKEDKAPSKDSYGRKIAPPPSPYEDRGLGKPALDRISMAAAISWDPRETRRLDDGSHPLYARYQAVGMLRQFDATIGVLPIGTRTLDLRRGSAAESRYSAARLAEMRKNIDALCETMARLRVLRSLGARTTYTREELRKPFYVARIIFTGRTDDPELRKVFATMAAASMLGASRALYGEPAPEMLPAPVPTSLRRPPPVGTDDDEDVDDDGVVHRHGAPVSRASAKPVARPRTDAQPAPARARAQAPAPSPPAQSRVAPRARERQAPAPAEPGPRDRRPMAPPRDDRPFSGFVIPGGNERDVPIERATNDSLAYWVDRISLSLDRGEAREGDDELVDAMIAEQAHRRDHDRQSDDFPDSYK